MKSICCLCGNPIEISLEISCRYCGHKNSSRKSGKKYSTINLEIGMPTIEMARQKMRTSLADCRANGCLIIKYIHGYGSTGKGGVIRPAVRASLVKLVRSGEIQNVIYGELVESKKQNMNDLMTKIPKLKNDRDLKIPNEGVTYVVL